MRLTQQQGCPVDPDVCTLATQLDALIGRRDFAQIADHLSPPTAVDCPDPAVPGVGGPYPLCDDAPAGERRLGYLLAGHEGGWGLAQHIRDFLKAWAGAADDQRSDGFGTGAVRVHTVGCASSCDEGAAIVFSAMQHRPDWQPGGRLQVIFLVDARTDPAKVYGVLRTLSTGGPIMTGGDAPSFTWRMPADGGRGQSSSGRFFRWRPPQPVAPHIRGEIENMRYFLRVVTREDVPCGVPCARNEDFASVVDMLHLRCHRFGPSDQRGGGDYDGARDGAALDALEAACTIVADGITQFGPPAETPDWVTVANRAKEQLVGVRLFP